MFLLCFLLDIFIQIVRFTLLCIGPLIYGHRVLPLSSTFTHLTFLQFVWGCWCYIYIQGSSKKEKNTNSVIIFFDKSIGSWKTMVVYYFFCKLSFGTTILQFVIQYNLSFAKCDKCFISFDITFQVWLDAFWATCGTKQSYAILGLRHDLICCCLLRDGFK